jgi:hypothetical protein
MNSNEQHHNKYIKNKFIDKDLEANYDDIIKGMEVKLQELLNSQLLQCPPDQEFIIDSLGKQSKDPFIYAGTGSDVYIFWRYYLLCKNKYPELKEKAKELFNSAFSTNYAILLQIESDEDYNFKEVSPSFFMSPVGIYTIGCLSAYEQQNKIRFDQLLKRILNYYESAMQVEMENELLYGNTGFLYCLVLLNKQCKEFIQNVLDSKIFNLMELIIKEGLKYQDKGILGRSMIWPFPKSECTRKRECYYIGAAHGLTGVLYILLLSLESLNLTDLNEYYSAIVKESIDYLATVQFESGNFPLEIGSKEDKLRHFCHGSPGAIPLFLKASEIYSDDSYLKIALKAGEDLWQKGILKKGNGLCHGISGNAYFLHSIYLATSDTLWKNRTLLFAQACMDKEIQEEIKSYKDPQRNVKGVPDTPFSLMEGQGGVICFFSDLLNEESFMKYPGYEV